MASKYTVGQVFGVWFLITVAISGSWAGITGKVTVRSVAVPMAIAASFILGGFLYSQD